MLTGKTTVVGVVADPIVHVQIVPLFNALMEKHGKDVVLVPFHVKPEDFATFIAGVRKIRSLAGLVVTVPHKETVTRYCTGLSDASQRIGSANVVRISHEENTMVGGNFDGAGFTGGLIAQGHQIQGKRVYLAGTGGTGKSLAHALAQRGAAAVGIYNRTESSAVQLVESLRKHYPEVDTHIATAAPENYDIAVNATSLGLKPDDALPFDLSKLAPTAVVAEVVMAVDMTPLLAAAQQRGHAVHIGRHMINAQINEIAHFLGLI